MNDLTDKWKKGELPSGWYYVRLIRGEYRIDLYINDKNEWIDCPDNIIDTIVCEVPSYEEWKAKLEENTKLKELLKDARNVLKMVDTYYGDYDSTKGFLIVERIDEVLK